MNYVFGYASLVAQTGDAVLGRLHGYRRCWGVAMNNWEGGEEAKHFLDRRTGDRSRIRVAYLDIESRDGSTVNGIAIPVDAERLSAFDAREVNYERVDVTDAFELAIEGEEVAGGKAPGDSPACIFAYMGLEAARNRCRQGAADGNLYASRDYVASVRLAFERLGADALAEYERTTDPLLFPERDLQVVMPRRLAS